jgi:hypothetical protein
MMLTPFKSNIIGNWQVALCCAAFPAIVGPARPANPSGVGLTFATHLAASWQSECQILNSTRILNLLAVF